MKEHKEYKVRGCDGDAVMVWFDATPPGRMVCVRAYDAMEDRAITVILTMAGAERLAGLLVEAADAARDAR